VLLRGLNVGRLLPVLLLRDNISYKPHSMPTDRQYKAREVIHCRKFPRDSDCGNAHRGISHSDISESASNFPTINLLKCFSNVIRKDGVKNNLPTRSSGKN
jgi:hypothetical protein